MFRALKYFVSYLVLLKCSIETRSKEDLGQNVVSVSRVNGGDLFTVSDMISRSTNCSSVSGNEFKESHFVNKSDGVCTFRCNTDKPTYLVHERKCVNFSQLLNNLPTSTEDREDCRQWLSVNYDKQGTYTRKISNVIDFEKNGFINLEYHGFNTLLLEHASCSIINEKLFYINQGEWKSLPLEIITIGVAVDEVSATLQWAGVHKKKFLGKIIKVKLRCVSETNKDQEERFCIIFKTKGTTSVPPGTAGSTETTCTTHKSSTSEEQTIAPRENKNSHVTGIVATAVVVVLVLLFVAGGLFVKRRHLRKRAINNGPSNSNPTYERGPDASSICNLEMNNKEKELQEDTNNYQPLIQNTKIKDSSGRIPVYQHLIKNESNKDCPQKNSGMYAVRDISPRCKQNVDSGNQQTIIGETGKEFCSPNMASGISKSVPVNHRHNIEGEREHQYEPGHNPGQVQGDSTSSSSNVNIHNKQKVCEQDPYYHVLDISTNTDNSEKESKQGASAQAQYYHVLDISNPINKIM